MKKYENNLLSGVSKSHISIFEKKDLKSAIDYFFVIHVGNGIYNSVYV